MTETQQSRRRRRTPPKSQISSALILVGVVALADVAVANLAPISVGVRSAFANSLPRRCKTSFAPRSSDSRQWERTVIAASTSPEDDLELVETAFFRPKSPYDAARMRSAQYADLKRTKRSNEKLTELDFLESSIGLPSGVSLVSSSPTVKHTDARPVQSATSGATKGSRGGSAELVTRPLAFWENMICGATSRSVAQTIMHPANTMKTILQNARSPTDPGIFELMEPRNFNRLTRGAGANFLLSMPHGAVNFAVLEFVRKKMGAFVKSSPILAEHEDKWGAGLDFLSSAISTITCSIVSTPQMMITDNIMAGNYPNLPTAITGLARSKGIAGFYAGWWPGLVGKIPSYALTWTFFQQLKLARDRLSNRPATDLENSIMGCIASGTTVCLMIPMDTIKTRLVTQAGRAASDKAYKGIIDCAIRVFREEGLATFYRGLPPRLVSVVPMIGIQFGVYEAMKRVMLKRQIEAKEDKLREPEPEYLPPAVLEEAMMEVAASPEHPYPAPQFLKRFLEGTIGNGKNGKSGKKK